MLPLASLPPVSGIYDTHIDCSWFWRLWLRDYIVQVALHIWISDHSELIPSALQHFYRTLSLPIESLPLRLPDDLDMEERHAKFKIPVSLPTCPKILPM